MNAKSPIPLFKLQWVLLPLYLLLGSTAWSQCPLFIDCPPDIVRGNDRSDCLAEIPFVGTPTISGTCIIYGLTNDAPTTFPLGTTVVTWVVTGHQNNTAACSQNVTIEDTEYPIITCPPNIKVKTDVDDCIATVDYTATATDNCPELLLTYSADPPAAFNIGLTNVEVTATDGAGNAVSCVIQILVGTRTEVCNGLDDDCDGWVDEAEDWERIAKLHSSDARDLDEYGRSVDIDGDYAIVGSKKKNDEEGLVGAAYILHRNTSNVWSEMYKLTGDFLSAGDDFGASVTISGGIAAVAAPGFDVILGSDEGSVFIFYQNPDNPSEWQFIKQISALDPDPGDNFGVSIALDGDRLLVGANMDDQAAGNAGAAYIFYRNQGGDDNWGQVAKLLSTGGKSSDNFGISVALDGDYAVVGAPGVDGIFQNAGAAYVFGRHQTGPDKWGQLSRMRASLSGLNDNFGISVAVSGPWAIVGADHNDRKGVNAGAAFAFYKNQNGVNGWGQKNIILDYGGRPNDHYGCAVSIDGEYAVVGSSGDDDLFGYNSGRGFVYLRQDDGWVLVGTLEDGGGQEGDALGSCAAISGRTVILGEQLDNTSSLNVGAVLLYGGLCMSDDRSEAVSNFADISGATVNCFPVPFRDVLNIEVKGVKSSNAQVEILNTLGQTIANLHNGLIEGDATYQWRPSQATPGIYFLRVIAGEEVMTKTIVLER